jgi:hypothetical protein
MTRDPWISQVEKLMHELSRPWSDKPSARLLLPSSLSAVTEVSLD